jgi:hypothetical protein
MRGLQLCSYYVLLSTSSAFSVARSLWHYGESTSALDSQGGNLELLAAKLDVLQGVVKDLHKREKLHQQNLSVIDNQHMDKVSITRHQQTDIECRNGKNLDLFDADIRRQHQEQQSDEQKIVQLTCEIGILSENIKGLETKLDRMNTEIDTANEIIALERGVRTKSDEIYNEEIRDLQIEHKEDRVRLMSDLESERVKSARYLADVVTSTEQARYEKRKREEREEIASAAVKASQKSATLLEEKLLASEKKVSRLRAQIKLQQLLMHAFLEKAT